MTIVKERKERMFAAELARLKGLCSSRSPQWTGKLGPVAWWGADGADTCCCHPLLETFRACSQLTDADFYLKLKLVQESPAVPQQDATVMPVLEAGGLCCKKVPAASPSEWYSAVRNVSAHLTTKGFVPFCVGATNCILPTVEGLKDAFLDDVVLLHFGADPLLSTAASPLRVLLEKRCIRGLVQIGTRGVTSEARRVRKEHSVKYVDMNSAFSKGIFTVKDMRNDLPIFLSVDVGVLDPAFAPGVALPEPGGMSTRELCHMISVIRGPRIVGMSLTGYSPPHDVLRQCGDGLTCLAAAKIAKEMIVKAYSISTVTAAEGMAHVKEQQQQSPYPPK